MYVCMYWGTGFSGLTTGLATLPLGGSRSLQWSETGMEDPQEDPLAVHCFCVCSGSALLGNWLERLLWGYLNVVRRLPPQSPSGRECLCVFFFSLVCLCFYVSPRPYTVYISYIHDTIQPICAESVVKHQQTNQPNPMYICMYVCSKHILIECPALTSTRNKHLPLLQWRTFLIMLLSETLSILLHYRMLLPHILY